MTPPDFCDYCQRTREPIEALAVLYRLMGQAEKADGLDSLARAGFIYHCRSCGGSSTDYLPKEA